MSANQFSQLVSEKGTTDDCQIGREYGPKSVNRQSPPTYSRLPKRAPADRNAPFTRLFALAANCMSTSPSICRVNAAVYGYHQTFFIRGRRSEATYLIRTISSRPNLPWVRPIPLDLMPPCGASLMPKHETASFTCTVPAAMRRANTSP